ncbi:MAG: hypothetical protein HYU99_09595 [Deltaproteobacteria bacterium]|nr:hypothetical protein [Deltaproteobacteria bacterium]
MSHEKVSSTDDESSQRNLLTREAVASEEVSVESAEIEAELADSLPVVEL